MWNFKELNLLILTNKWCVKGWRDCTLSLFHQVGKTIAFHRFAYITWKSAEIKNSTASEANSDFTKRPGLTEYFPYDTAVISYLWWCSLVTVSQKFLVVKLSEFTKHWLRRGEKCQGHIKGMQLLTAVEALSYFDFIIKRFRFCLIKLYRLIVIFINHILYIYNSK